MNYRSFAAIFLLVLVIPVGLMALGRQAKKTIVQGDTMYTLLPPGAIPAIFEPEFIKAKDADQLYYPDEPLMAVVRGEEARAYSTWHLDHHEIVNDHLDGNAIAVTW